MASARSKAWLWPLWIGLLSFPLAGWRVALGITAAGLAIMSAKIALPKFWPRTVSWPSWPAFSSQARRILLSGVLLLSLLLPVLLNRYSLDVAITAGIYIALALGLNIIIGLAGMLVLGYIAFYAAGAYAYAILSTQFNISFFSALPAAALLALVFGLVLGMPTLRLRGDYLAIVTLGFGEIIRIVLNNWDGLTGGPNGIMHIPRPEIWGLRLGTPAHLYYLVLAMVLLVAFLTVRLNDSRLGRALVAMREDETAARSCGINTVKLKLLAFSLSAVVAGLMGVIFAAKMSFISPESFTFWESVMVLCMVVLGGMASVPGVMLGAAALVILPEAFRQFQNYRMLVFGAAMVAMMIFRPQGLIPSRRRKLELSD